jgi:hypothetical protein
MTINVSPPHLASNATSELCKRRVKLYSQMFSLSSGKPIVSENDCFGLWTFKGWLLRWVQTGSILAQQLVHQKKSWQCYGLVGFLTDDDLHLVYSSPCPLVTLHG